MNPSDGNLLLVKDNLAAFFREEIISGRFAPGEKIVEVQWAKTLQISQTSVREAINILSAEGFVQKGSGRTAQVTKLSDQDVLHSYELRAVLEGYAARLVAERQPDLTALEQILADMSSAIDCSNLRAFYERDLLFHLALAEKSGNRMLSQAIRRVVVPLFAFVVIRVQGARTEESQWMRSLGQHKRIIEALKTGDPTFAERLVSQTVGAFFKETKDLFRSTEAGQK
jgi:DNA-binding GntR family transcriptional regulator